MTEEMMSDVMMECIRIARHNLDNNQYPIASIVADNTGKIISSSCSTLRSGWDPTNHPEMDAIRKASEVLKQRKLHGYYLFSTLEPCPMCTSAAIWAAMEGIVYGSSQQEVIDFVKDNPNHLLSWRQIPISASYIISRSQPKLLLIGGVQKELCQQLFK